MKLALAIAGFVAIQLAVIVLGFAADSNQWIAGGIYTLTPLAILGSLIAACVSCGRARSAWSGFALFALAYFFFAVIVNDLWAPAARFVNMRAEPQQLRFVTSFWLAWLYDHLGGPQTQLWTSGGTRVPALHLLNASPGLIPKDMDLSTLDAFMRTGQCVFTWLAGAVGGVVGAWFYRLPQTTDLAQPASADRL